MGGTDDVVGQFADMESTACRFKFARLAKLVGDGEHVDGLIHLEEFVDGPEDDLMFGAVEILFVQ